MLHQHTLDKTVPIPLYFQLKTLLLDELKSGAYPVDSMIPTEKELSKMFDISRTTVRQTMAQLVQEGWLYRVKSKGTFVARTKIKQDFIRRLETYKEQMERLGYVPSTQLLALEATTMPDHIVSQANITPGMKAVYMFRRRFASGEPIVTVETYLPYDSCSFLMDHDMSSESMYDVLSTRETTRICRVTRVLEAVAANSQDSELLDVKRGKPIHYFKTIGYNKMDEPIEFSFARYRGDRNRFEVDLLIDTAVQPSKP